MSSELQNPDLTIPRISDKLPVLKFIFESLYGGIWDVDPFTGKSLKESYHEFIEMSERLKLVKLCIRSVLSDDSDLAGALAYRSDAKNYKLEHYYNSTRVQLVGCHEHMPLNATMDRIRGKVNTHKLMGPQGLNINIDDIIKYFELKREHSDAWILAELANIDTNGKTIIDTTSELNISELIVITQEHYNEYHERFMTFWLNRLLADQLQMSIAFEKGDTLDVLKKFAEVVSVNMQTTYTDKGVFMRCVLRQLYRFIYDIERTVEENGDDQ